MCPDPSQFPPRLAASQLTSSTRATESAEAGVDDEFLDITEILNEASPAQTPSAPASSNFVSRLIYQLLDWVCDKFGEKLKAGSVGNYLDAAFLGPEWRKNKISVSDRSVESDTNHLAPPLRTRTLAYRQQLLPGMTTIITDPCHDMPPGTPYSEHIGEAELSVAECLNKLCQQKSVGSVNVQIPICQSSRIAGRKRDHFALLNATIVDGKLIQAYLVDSKSGFIDYFYDGARHIEEQLRSMENFPVDAEDAFTIKTQYLGDQSLINGTDCGRFAVAHAQNFVTAKDDAYHPMNHDDFFHWCTSIQDDVDAAAAQNLARDERI